VKGLLQKVKRPNVIFDMITGHGQGHILEGSRSLRKVMSYSILDSEILSLTASFSACLSIELLCVFSTYGPTQPAQSNVLNTAPPTEAQPQFAAYHQDVVQSTGSPHHSYHPHAPATAGPGSNVVNMSAVQTFNSVALPAQNLL